MVSQLYGKKIAFPIAQEGVEEVESPHEAARAGATVGG